MTNSEKSTTERLVGRYNTFTRRRTAHDPADRQVIFKSFRRVYGRFLPSDRHASILDVGCGEGSFLTFLRALGYDNLSGFDLSLENVSICRGQGLDFVEHFDALQLDRVPGGRFDMIFALDILEHLPKEEGSTFVERARDRLKPGGRLIVQTPNMGCVYGLFHRYNDLSHEFSLTEKTARDLFMTAGFRDEDIHIEPAWHATTVLGRLRELYARALHLVVFLADDRDRPRIPTKNLLIKATR